MHAKSMVASLLMNALSAQGPKVLEAELDPKVCQSILKLFPLNIAAVVRVCLCKPRLEGRLIPQVSSQLPDALPCVQNTSNYHCIVSPLWHRDSPLWKIAHA